MAMTDGASPAITSATPSVDFVDPHGERPTDLDRTTPASHTLGPLPVRSTTP